MRILQHRKLYGEKRFHAAFPSIARFSDGNLLLAFRRARDGLWLVPEDKRQGFDPLNRMDHMDSRSHIVLMELDPTGEQPIGELDMLPIDPEAGDQDPSLLIMPDDSVFLASFSWYPLPVDAAALMAGVPAPGGDAAGCRFIFWGSHSSLRGRAKGQWQSHHRYLLPDHGYGKTVSPDGHKVRVGPTRGRSILRDGEIFLPIYEGLQDGCALFASGDQGNTWRYHCSLARDGAGQVTFQEPALCEDGKGGMVCFMRTAGAEGRLATTHSTDGKEWSDPILHELVGHPFHPLLLKDGRVLLTYGYREKPFGIRARLLSNPRQDPDEAEEFILRDDGLCADLGYPWAVELKDGRVLVAYYWTDDNGSRQILGTWLALPAAAT